MERIEQALKNRRESGYSENQTYALKDKEGNISLNMHKVAEELFGDVYSRQGNQDIMPEVAQRNRTSHQ